MYDLLDKDTWDQIWSIADPDVPEDSGEQFETPAQKLLAKAAVVEKLTPEAVPRPLAKVQLQAAKKLEQKMDNSVKLGKKTETEKSKKENDQVDAKKSTKQPSKEKKTKKDQSGKPKKKKAPANGPMTAALKEFVARMKDEGFPYMEAMRLWKNSDERLDIVENLSEAECKRRRY